MSARKKFDPVIHDENPEWTREDFAKSRPAEELPAEILAQFKNKGGRPRLENPKEAVKLRLDADVLAEFRKTGPGWQTRINATLRSALTKGLDGRHSGKSKGLDVGHSDKPTKAAISKRKRA
jgi:uncharacterized protein (DUF4415 family)